jgi:hypothetical protein
MNTPPPPPPAAVIVENILLVPFEPCDPLEELPPLPTVIV